MQATILDSHHALTECRNGSLMLFDPWDLAVGLHFLRDGEHEPFLEPVIKPLLVNHGVVVIVGSNYGYWDVFCGRSVSDPPLYAFEANPALIPYLRRNLLMNGILHRATITHCAVTDTVGETVFHVSPDNLGGGSVEDVRDPLFPDRTTLTVPTTTLDAYFGESLPNITFLKIDAEGSEAAVLRGMARILKECPPRAIMLEYIRPFQTPALREAVGQLSDLGYRIRCVNDAREWPIEPGHLPDVEYVELVCTLA